MYKNQRRSVQNQQAFYKICQAQSQRYKCRYAVPMKLVFDAFWRAAAYCLHPRVIALSLLPLVIMVALALGLGYLFWDDALNLVNSALTGSDWVTRILLGSKVSA